MGTRADFYIGRGKDAEWLGSIGWDGHPDSMPTELRTATTEDAFRGAVKALASREDWTAPVRGWPWPWDDSGTTDYAYAYDEGAAHASCFGGPWFPATLDETSEESDGEQAVFPDMTARKNVTLGARSGTIVIGA